MIVFSRKQGESIDVTTSSGDRITIKLNGIKSGKASIGIEASRDVLVNRHEVTQRIESQQQAAVA